MGFETEIQHAGENYILMIESTYDESEGYPSTIDISIQIKKVVGNETFLADYLALRYTDKTREYTIINEPEGKGKEMYNDIISTLDNTYPDMWRYEIN